MKQRTRVALDAKRIVSNASGLGSYGRTLANDLAGIGSLDLLLYAPTPGRKQLRGQVPERDNLHYVYPERQWPKPLKGLYNGYWRSRGVVRQLQRNGIQVYHGLSGELPLGIGAGGIRSVVTIHDLIFMRHPEYYNPIDVAIYKWKFRQTIRQADRIVAISECTRRDISELGGIDASRIDLVYQSCAPRFSAEVSTQLMQQVRQHYRLPQRYILGVGTIEPRKNMLLALQALHHVSSEVCLVLVGRQTAYAQQLQAYAHAHQLEHRLLMLSGVPDEHLPAIYAAAEVFVYPSRYEGFGIPIIEAIQLRLPVVACTGSCLEEAGGPDNLYVSPDDAEGMAHAISRSLKGAAFRSERIDRSLAYVQRFAGNSLARQFADIYEELLPG